jgi:hypothetical protein
MSTITVFDRAIHPGYTHALRGTSLGGQVLLYIVFHSLSRTTRQRVLGQIHGEVRWRRAWWLRQA